MPRVRVGVLAVGLIVAVSGSTRAQGPLIGDVAGFGPWGVSNGKGYGLPYAPPSPNRFGPRMDRLAQKMVDLGMHGYYTPLTNPVDFGNGPSPYYQSVWSGLNGVPRPDVAERGWGYSPPWSANYRQGEPRKLAGLFHRRKRD